MEYFKNFLLLIKLVKACESIWTQGAKLIVVREHNWWKLELFLQEVGVEDHGEELLVGDGDDPVQVRVFCPECFCHALHLKKVIFSQFYGNLLTCRTRQHWMKSSNRTAWFFVRSNFLKIHHCHNHFILNSEPKQTNKYLHFSLNICK